MRKDVCDCKTGRSTDQAEQHTLREDLADDSASWCAQRRAHGHLGTVRSAARQQQVGDVRARDQQDDTGENHQHAHARAGLLLQFLDAAAPGGKNYVLARYLCRTAIGGVLGMRRHPLAQIGGELGLQGRNASLRAHPAQQIKPCRVLVTLGPQGRACTFYHGLVRQGHPEVGWALNDAITKESRWRDADHREGMCLNIDRGAHDIRVAGEIGLPGRIAENQNRRGTRLIVPGQQGPPAYTPTPSVSK